MTRRGWLGDQTIASMFADGTTINAECDSNGGVTFTCKEREVPTTQDYEMAKRHGIKAPYKYLDVHISGGPRPIECVCSVGANGEIATTFVVPQNTALLSPAVVEFGALNVGALTEALARVEHAGVAAFERVVQMMRAWDPTIRDVRARIYGSQWTPAIIRKDGILPLAAAGDGIKRFFVAASRLLTASDIVYVEEPELFQHAGVHGKIADAIWGCVDRGVQVFVTTHSLESFLQLRSRTDGQPLGTQERTFGLVTTTLTDGQLSAETLAGGRGAFVTTRISELLAKCNEEGGCGVQP